ncbi:MAG: phosphotransferase, partial [Pseudomonadota bacterium]
WFLKYRIDGKKKRLSYPNFSLADARTIEAAHAVEVYNHSCAVGADRPHGFWHLDRLSEEGRRLNLIATDDAHFSEPDAFGGWVMAKAEANEPEALLEALKAGRTYASTGPEIRDLAVEEKALHIECSAAAAIIVSGPGSAAVALHGSSMTKATIKLSRFGDAPWIRVTVVDAAGRRAWANPIWR